MAWPYSSPPARSNSDPQLDNHPVDHSLISTALTELGIIESGAGILDSGISGGISWTRWGNLVCVQFVAAGQGGKLIGTIPSHVRPANWALGGWWAYNSSGTGAGATGSCRISATGSVFQDGGGTVPAGGVARGRATYIIGENPAY